MMAQTEADDNRIALMVDTWSYASKPDASEVGKVKARMRKRGSVLLSPEDVFQELVSGHSIIPAEMVGGVRSGDWRSQRLFMVDIDGGSTVQEVAERYEDAGLSPAFVYHTYSSAEGCEKFRFAFLADDCVQNGTARDIIQATLMGIAGCADEKCADRARYFNGTDKGGEFFGSEVDTERLLCLWDESYASYLPQIGKKAAKTENTAKKEQKRKSGASGRSYNVVLSDNIIPFSRGLFRMNAKHDLGMLDRFFKARAWVEGDHRERFCFVYYNLAKLVYGAEEAYTLVEEKVSQMQEPLSDRELYWAITHTENHIETSMPDLHGDGVFLFHRKTIASDKWLEMTDEEAIACGIFATSDKNARADKNRGVKRERDELIASLFVDGKSVREIKSILDERYGDLSLGKRSIEKMRKKMCEKIPPTIFLYNISLFYSPKTLSRRLVRMVASATRNGFSASQERFLHSVLHGNRNLLLSGIAGAGKSHVMKESIRMLEANGCSVAVCAATGMASSNFADSSTFHRLFCMDCDGDIFKKSDAMRELASYNVVFVDEASMIKKKHMESAISLLEETMEQHGRAPRLVLSFDALQLPPVKDGYFFEAEGFDSMNFECHYLSENMRQGEHSPLTNALNFLRVGENVASCCRYLNAACSHAEDEGSVYLYARRKKADAKNAEVLRKLPGEEFDLGNIRVKLGCEVLITENSRHDSKQEHYNGQRGVLEVVQAKRVGVRVKSGELIWLYKKVLLDVDRMPLRDENGRIIVGYPIQLAYAVTIHKSQGMTLESANIDPECFADGQLYVALSRVKTIGGIHLLGLLEERFCKVSSVALTFDRWMKTQSGQAA